MISNVRSTEILSRLARNLIVVLAVTAIFALKAAEPRAAHGASGVVALAAH
ncbi:MAG: hypothetical protein R3C42_01680 [Parvularculaceae bacterium]|nr:hypothetical protein [Parvularculaceae bacterium]